MKKYFLYACALGLLPLYGSAQSISYGWVNHYSGTASNKDVRGIAVDDAGNLFATGTYQGGYVITGDDTMYTTGGSDFDAFISKTSTSGSTLWSYQIGGAANQFSEYIAVDKDGYSYTVGRFQNTVNFNPSGTGGTITAGAANVDYAFVLKLDPAGNFVWVKSFGGNRSLYPTKIKLDDNGNIYIIGGLSSYVADGVYDLDPGTGVHSISGTSIGDAFLSKWSSNGDFLFGRHLVGAGTAASLALGANGDIYLAGSGSPADIVFPTASSSITLPKRAGTSMAFDTWVVRANSNGYALWAKLVAGNRNDFASGLAVNAAGGVFLAGGFQDTVDFSSGLGSPNAVRTTTNRDDLDAFLLHLDRDGVFRWVRQFHTNDYDGDRVRIVLDRNEDVVLATNFSGAVTLSHTTPSVVVRSNGREDILLTTIGSDGSLKKIERAGSRAADYINDLFVAGDSLYIGGAFSGPRITFGSNELYLSAGRDVFLSKALLKSSCNTVVSRTGTVAEAACDSFELGGETWTNAGTFTKVIANSAGCDSLVTFNLTVTRSVSGSDLLHTDCDSFTFNGVTYTESGVYTQHFPAANGCDSIFDLQLTIYKSAFDTATVTACKSYEHNGVTYTDAGFYITDTLATADGCDSFLVLDLQFLPLKDAANESGTLVAAQDGAVYQWVNCNDDNKPVSGATAQRFTPEESGRYAVVVTLNGCEDTSGCIVYEAPASVLNINAGNFSIWPNPAKDVLHIRSAVALTDATVRLTNQLGQSVRVVPGMSGAALKVALDGVPSGFYLLQITEGGKVYQQKVVVQ